MQRHAQEIAPSLPLASFLCLDLAGSHGVAPAGRTRPEHPTVRGPSSAPGSQGPDQRLFPLQTALDPSMGTTSRPGSCQEEFPALHPGSLKSQVWLEGRPEGLGLKAGREREAGGPGSSRCLKSGSAKGSGDPWAQAQLQRHLDT